MATILDLRQTVLPLATVMALGACASGRTRVSAVPTTSAAHAAVPATQKPTLALADSAWRAGAYPLATELYDAIVARDSSPPVAVFRLATLRSWDNRLDESLTLFRRSISLEPHFTEAKLSLARVTAWTGRYSSAIAIYDSVIAREPGNRDAFLGRAQTLAWAHNSGAALAAYERWIAAHPNDHAASMDYARALAWDGQLDRAESVYATLARTGNANATKGLARVIGWKGDLQRSEHTWRQVLITDPADPEALTGLAQVLSWQGRQTDAEAALQRALQVNPVYGDARTLLRLVQADLRPSVTMSAVGTNDIDDNRSTSFHADYVVRAPWNGSVGARVTERWANFAAIDSRAHAVNLLGRWQPGTSAWVLRADAGITRHSSTLVPAHAPARTLANAGLRASGTLGRSVTVGVAASLAPFDETALLIANGVVSTEIGGEAEIALPGPVSLSGAAGYARLTGGTRKNSRVAFSSTLRWIASRSWSLAVGARQFGYDTTSSDGYFAPRKYTLTEASGRGRVGRDLGWNAEGNVGIGRQSIAFFGASAASRRAERAALTAGYRFSPSHEFSASGSYANVAAPAQSTNSEYKAYTFSLRARVGL